MRTKAIVVAAAVALAPGSAAAQMPGAQGPPPAAGLVIKGKAPVSNDVLRVKLPHLAGWTAARQRNAARYRALFDSAGLTDVKLPCEAPERTHIYNQFVIRVPKRDALRAHLDARGIGTEIYYPVPFHLQECFKDLGYQPGAFPVAEAQANDSVALPIYPELTEEQQAEVVNAIGDFYRGK